MNGTELKDIFLHNINCITAGHDSVAIALSSGIDSTANMFALLEMHKHITAYNFRIEGVKSQDYIHAKKNAETFGVKFVECIIPNVVDMDILTEIIERYKRKKKTDIECIYPFYHLFPEVQENVILTGGYADVHFCISKNGMIHYRHTLEKMNEYRLKLFNNPDTSQITELTLIGRERFNLKVDTAFNKTNMIDYFADKTWEEINRPRQKQSYLDMFPEQFEQIKRFNHTSLQCGDSMIRELFEPMLDDETLNKKGRKRMVDLYRDLYNGYHPKKNESIQNRSFSFTK